METPGRPAAGALASGRVQGVVPWLFFFELGNVCARKVRGRALDPDTAELFFETLDQCGFHLDMELTGPEELYRQAMRLGAQVGDSVYIALALQTGLPLASVDGGMRTGARNAGVELWRT